VGFSPIKYPMNDILKSLIRDLESNADPVWKEKAERFFKEPVKFHGLNNSDARKIGREHYKNLRGCSKAEIFTLCEELLKSGFMEESIIACDWSEKQKKMFTPDDFITFERWISLYITNWASCDTLCNHTVGEFIMMYPEFLSGLKQFTKSENRWMRRAAAVSLIIPAAKGKFLPDILEIATLLLHDIDDLVQKGYGWMLKSASKPYQKEVFEFVVQHKATMPRTALRYAIEKMPKEMKKIAMLKD
jgi:3-methyladenine DNA glycosylase AlkD